LDSTAITARVTANVNLSKRTLLVRAIEDGAKKTGRSRLLPISARLAAVLDMAKVDPAGREYPASAYVFGALGARVVSIDKAWETAVLKAHRHMPRWVKGGLSSESRATRKAMDFHFHDLRHEAGCRWLEQGWPIHHVHEMLGHVNLSQTSTCTPRSVAGIDETLRRRAWQTRGKAGRRRASACSRRRPGGVG
jgi:integrase